MNCYYCEIIFLSDFPFYICYPWRCTVRKSFSCSLFIIQCVLMNFYFIHWVIIYNCHYSFWCSNSPWFSQWETLQTGSCIHLTCPCHSLITSFVPGTNRCFRLTLFFPHPNPRTSHFSEELWFLLVEQHLKAKIHTPSELIDSGMSFLLGNFILV